MTDDNIEAGDIKYLIGAFSLIPIMYITLFIFSGEPAKKEDTYTLRHVGRERLKSELKDPDSLKIISEKVENGEYKATFRAKNGFGGYNGPENYSTK